MIKIEQKIEAYEVDGNEIRDGNYPALLIKSHESSSQLVTLRLGAGKTYSFIARDLQMAIENATNVNRY